MFKKIDLSKRSFGLDLLRAIAVLFVPAVHFFLNNYFYSFNMTDPTLILTASFRWLFYAGVPLFIMMSGYFKRNKTVSKSHYKTIFPILLSYFLISIATIFFRIFYLKEEMSSYLWVRSIFNFTSPSYAWYVEMYVGLFLIMPFINNAYNALSSRKQKNILIISMLFLTALPASLNHIVIQENSLDFISNYWAMLWPITYYFIGMYIAEFKPKIKNKFIGWLVIIAFVVAQSMRTYITAKGDNFYAGVNANYNDLITFLTSTLIFLCVYDIDCKKKAIHYPLYAIGNVSLSLYLCSFMADRLVYPYFYRHFPTQFVNVKAYIWIFPLIQICVVGMSFIAGNIVDFISHSIVKLISNTINSAQEKKRAKNIDTARTQEFNIIKQ